MLDTTGVGLLKSVEQLLSEIFIPTLRKMNHGWGELASPQAQAVKRDFMASLDSFVSVNLAECEGFDLRTLRGPSDYMAVANSAEAMERIEACLRVWIKQIEQVLAESDQLRKEADDLGPRAELDHWKKRMSRFNYLLDQLKSPDVRAVLGVLIVAKSKLIKSWKELDTRITDSANEAKDNVKYLYTLEKFCDPLYNSDPVTNQMITACKAYITSSGSVTIWDQPPEQVVERLTAAIHLNQVLT
ncbi:hypothetical protein CRUP_015477 [Coryphaenoides rupestris]|nr:hypothetical protein CRUP_015477 [Coryphaenoides rupestris]